MTKRIKYLVHKTFIFFVLTFIFLSCNEEFVNLNSGVITNDNATNFDIVKVKYPLIAYTKPITSGVQSNNLPLQSLGVYNDQNYGQTTSSILTQLTPVTLNVDFGEQTKLDSVILTIPLSSSITGTDEDGNVEYELDSVIGSGNFRLNLYESDFFLRSFDPNGDINDTQQYFSNKTASTNEPITQDALTKTPISYSYKVGRDLHEDNILRISDKVIVLEEVNEDNETVETARLAPAIRLKLDNAFWFQKIIETSQTEGNTDFLNANNFSNFFRGLYFEVQPIDNQQRYALLNLAASNAGIRLYYERDNTETEDDTTDVVKEIYALNFGTTNVNFFNNNFSIDEGNSTTGDERLYLKGGQGAITKIKLFNGSETLFNQFKNDFVETSNGQFIRSKRLVNEANLVFYLDEDTVNESDIENLSQRVSIYDADNNSPLIDYFADGQNSTFPELSLLSHLEPLTKVTNEDGSNQGYRYKIRITEHINNLLLRDSTNVELGLSPSLNVTLESAFTQREVQTIDGSQFNIPVSSAITPRGVILHGNNIPEGSENEDKKVYLEVIYTCMDDDDCPINN